MASVVDIVFTLKNNEKKDKTWGTPPKLLKNLSKHLASGSKERKIHQLRVKINRNNLWNKIPPR
jgi:hypothetical protein